MLSLLFFVPAFTIFLLTCDEFESAITLEKALEGVSTCPGLLMYFSILYIVHMCMFYGVVSKEALAQSSHGYVLINETKKEETQYSV